MVEQIVKDLKVLTGFGEADLAVLQKHQALISRWADEIVKAFYDTLYAYEPTAGVLGQDRAAREKTLREWYLEIASGKLDKKFWSHQWFVGVVHIKRKVPNRFMIGMMSRVQELFLHKSLEALPREEALELYAAFKRVSDMVVGLIAESYLENYFQALENTVGFKRTLVQRMMEVEIDKRLAAGY
ncbi:hypothetical protein JCM13664_14470 [Methylothermus subterraneus]